MFEINDETLRLINRASKGKKKLKINYWLFNRQ